MNKKRIIQGFIALFILIFSAYSAYQYFAFRGCENGPGMDCIELPPGFSIDFYAENITGARSMALGPKGTLFVGTRAAGKVYALPDRDRDGKADELLVLAEGLNMPNGVAWRNGSLYVAEVNRVLRFDGVETWLEGNETERGRKRANLPEPVLINDNFPSDAWHGWKYIKFGPDGKLYVPVGAPCNVCEREDERYASIMRMDPDGSGLEIFARGVRNSVGFAWHPETGEMWFTDNGRDWLGDDLPPDELNRATEPGLNFGFPYCHGGDLPDPDFGDLRTCEEFAPPELKLGPHVAALGMTFYTGEMFPPEYREQIFIAEHGSWNRKVPIGYRVSLVRLKNGKAVSYESFAEGWLQGFVSWGRPVDVLEMPDGSLLVSDDKNDAIYRISYG